MYGDDEDCVIQHQVRLSLHKLGRCHSPLVSVPYCIKNPLDWQKDNDVLTVPRANMTTAATKNQGCSNGVAKDQHHDEPDTPCQ
jgi:hypothetical protein